MNRNEKSIIVILKGGLGNQLFELLATLYYAEKNNIKEIGLYTHNLGVYKVKRKFQLEPFINIEGINIKIIQKHKFILNERIIRIISVFTNRVVSEKNFFKQRNYRNQIVNGYFQSNVFFKESIIYKIRHSFEKFVYSEYDSLIHQTTNKLIESLKSDTALAIHIRGSDYLTDNLYCTPNPKLIIEENYSQFNQIFVFTDDIKYGKKVLADINCRIEFVKDYNLHEIEELYLMSISKNLVIANSTFSLFGAILGVSPGKKIWAPCKWVNLNMENEFLLNICNSHNFILY